MAFAPTPTDVSVIISVATQKGTPGDRSPAFATERRVTPTWSISQLKGKLETMCGIPPGFQRLRLKSPGREDQWLDGDDQIVGDWGLGKGCEFEIHDQRPKNAQPDFTDVSTVEKFEISESTYESLPNSVLAWKKAQKLGRFNPNAASPEEVATQQVQKDLEEIKSRNIELSKRVIILPSSPPHIRRGTVRFIGPISAIPSPLSKTHSEIPDDLAPRWVGVEFDEPTGKNDGSVGELRLFTCPNKCGIFVKPEKIQVGDFPPLGLDDLEDDAMEEI